MLDKKLTYVVVGASSNKEKYGYKVLQNLIQNSYKAIPVNPKGGYILDQKVFKSINEIKPKPDMLIFVVKPDVTEKILEDAVKLGIKNVWMQPGSESEKSIEYCVKNKINAIYNACILIKNQS